MLTVFLENMGAGKDVLRWEKNKGKETQMQVREWGDLSSLSPDM